ncbi:hypothetical protein BKA70DRAFT_1227518 [Coprinopsis sp. MPI-PUGE-AT-0042]|nr:hypothetical protein BKA70DRAFT_1227518 [Coprinopsis sp. MPI-PUGE-AT-0042]
MPHPGVYTVDLISFSRSTIIQSPPSVCWLQRQDTLHQRFLIVPMDVLPIEVWSLIISRVARSRFRRFWLADLRLVCRLFNALAAPHLFRAVEVWNCRCQPDYLAIRRMVGFIELTSQRELLLPGITTVKFKLQGLDEVTQETFLSAPIAQEFLEKVISGGRLTEVWIIAFGGNCTIHPLGLKPLLLVAAVKMTCLVLENISPLSPGFFQDFIVLKCLRLYDATAIGKHQPLIVFHLKLSFLTMTFSSSMYGPYPAAIVQQLEIMQLKHLVLYWECQVPRSACILATQPCSAFSG